MCTYSMLLPCTYCERHLHVLEKWSPTFKPVARCKFKWPSGVRVTYTSSGLGWKTPGWRTSQVPALAGSKPSTHADLSDHTVLPCLCAGPRIMHARTPPASK